MLPTVNKGGLGLVSIKIRTKLCYIYSYEKIFLLLEERKSGESVSQIQKKNHLQRTERAVKD